MTIFEKLQHSITADGVVLYQNPHNPIQNLNDLVGHEITITLGHKSQCLGCKKTTRIQKGYCWVCFTKLARCDLCFLQPYRCHYDQGTCREPAWAQSVCFEPHIIYCALTSDFKVGITRATQLHTRWVDQGATWAKPLISTTSRKDAGLIERAMTTSYQWKDVTQWRDLISGNQKISATECRTFIEDIGLNQLFEAANSLQIPFTVIPDSEKNLIYPVQKYCQMKKSLTLQTEVPFTGILSGIIGQYLLFHDRGAINLRTYGGYNISIEKN
ncbi:MAG: DUF2797 domain-containing protein [Gammaproteobacteria bacterium]|nr:DUF2797 domain-containing protein [Gammaproteobacteria bacterium]